MDTSFPTSHHLNMPNIVIIGAGAAGLMAAIWAGRTNPNRNIIILDGARTIGAKILVSGGGRCNVTHSKVDARDYAGGTRNAIQKVLRRFEVTQTISFFRQLGVELKQEETGKLFPVSDSAKTVLNALLAAANKANVIIKYPRRVESITCLDDKFQISGEWGEIIAERVVLATGGQSLPKSGSDGQGYQLAKSLGHNITPRILPALVPLLLPPNHFICNLSGLTLPTTLELRGSKGEKLIAFTNSTLCTHFGLSGPSVLDISRYYLNAKLDDARTILTINWLPDKSREDIEKELQNLNRLTLLRYLHDQLPERLARALCQTAELEPDLPGYRLTREQRKLLVNTITALPLPISGDRGFSVAEVTAGGIPLTEINLNTMASRICTGLYLCGEICDVDGRIGGFNFQWAWASGYLAGISI